MGRGKVGFIYTYCLLSYASSLNYKFFCHAIAGSHCSAFAASELDLYFKTYIDQIFALAEGARRQSMVERQRKPNQESSLISLHCFSCISVPCVRDRAL